MTWNRLALLEECLDALDAQTVDLSVVVVDNASTDDTAAWLAERQHGRPTEVLTLPTNTGGSGGFNTGLRTAYAGDADLFWLLDDDTIAAPDCLERMLDKVVALGPDRVDVIGSRVEWVDGTRHTMNAGWASTDLDQQERAAGVGCVAMEALSFVSCLVARHAVERHGLPMRDYFLWLDDFEYTQRILRDGFGVLVPDSVAVHKTTYTGMGRPGARYYYRVRNTIWMIRFSPAYAAGGRSAISARCAVDVARELRRHSFDGEQVRAALRGARDGIRRRPGLDDLEPIGNGGRHR